ncbi:phosphoribosyl-AMP cyclohydrolase [Cyanobium sp. Alchichica 3B3-8F6]|uniref:phosphoribosyl-AMP cyclohydrolase n=1 Tax=Cyanobium sp. Alchichica 3B3-8F6 TaxID=2823696 RepID=UPI0020CC297E|nr:phosphoribosyl-AMP cyclohydrolase [Cyanobium sp. Alchichica 3B3-8F6]MCP9882074.1 phosphoribosyl-AMP cyclohydrolase [Cyanobium sp. Alchichica 3B3-8F6]
MNASDQWPVACIHHLRFNSDGLIPAIAQDWLDGAVLMLAWMNRASLLATFETGQVHYWSRSRQELWHKGATSGHLQLLRGFRYDCDADALLLSVEQVGDVACHTGARGCFYETGATPTGGGPAALAPPADALSDRAHQRLLDLVASPVQEPLAKLHQATEALAQQWQRPPGTDDLACALALLDALQDSLGARGIPWRELLWQARRSPLE